MTDQPDNDQTDDFSEDAGEDDTPDEESTGSDDHTRTAQESARDLAKLLVSLASAVVTLSAAFADKFSAHAGWVILILFVAWGFLAASVVYGVTAISNLVHAQWTLAQKWGDITFPPMKRSWLFFQIGMVSLLVYAAASSGTNAFADEKVEQPLCCRDPGAVASKNGQRQSEPVVAPKPALPATKSAGAKPPRPGTP